MFTRHSASRLVAGLALAAGLAACTAEPNAPEVSQNGVMRSTGDVTAFRGNVTICKSSTDAAKAVVGKFVLEASKGSPLSASYDIESGAGTSNSCIEVWTGAGMSSEETADITVTELVDPSYALNRVVVVRTDANGVGTVLFDSNVSGLTTNIYTYQAISGTSLQFQFKNEPKDVPPPPPPPPGGGEGCTPGYWKQSQHFDSWVGFNAVANNPNPGPATLFDAVFGRPAFPGMTLLQVLGQGGGGLKALGRHTAAALLNTANAGVDYGYTTAGVIAAFQAAYDSEEYETQKNLFAAQNNLGCPLN